MWLKLLRVVVILFLIGSIESRPQRIVSEIGENGWRPISSRRMDSFETALLNSRPQDSNPQRELKDLKDMDLSLRTVATQLLNVTGPEDFIKMENKQPPQSNVKLITYANSQQKEVSSATDNKGTTEAEESSMEKGNTETVIIDSTGMIYGRPINSKFAYFGSGHPGEAMAITEEELEKELSLTKVTTIQKTQQTTTGGISTWILLNPPSTTMKHLLEDTQIPEQLKDDKSETTTKPLNPTTISSNKVEETSATTLKKVTSTQSTTVLEKISTPAPKMSNSTNSRKTTIMPLQTQKPQKTTQSEKKPAKNEQVIQNTTTKNVITTITSTPKNKEETFITSKPTSTTKKVLPVNRTTVKVKVTTSKTPSNTTVSLSTRTARPDPQSSKPKSPLRKTTPKPEFNKTETHYTSKIEKVTFKPVPAVNTEKIHVGVSEQPVFITKLKASVNTEVKKPVINSSSKISNNSESTEAPTKPKPNFSNKGNNVLKVQLKKPVDDLTKIEIQPIKVNAPVLKIEKVEKDTKKVSKNDEYLLNNTKIDLKFDFNPELTKIDVEKSSESTTLRTTTKRPRQSSKRKKNKGRRRKPSSTTTTEPNLSTVTYKPSSTDFINSGNGIQESKIEPETKVAATNLTKIKKKQTQNPISTQIYNFLSREVMPSFGVMSLVGLGLGLASYFLYPFGGTIARRNYVVEPNYKYNLDEYGGNYGQNEEDVLSKVFQGMTHHDTGYDNNYYRYQNHDGTYSGTTKKNDVRYSTVAGSKHRPIDNTGYDVSYRNTEFKYSELSTTPTYYERQKKVEYVVNNAGNGNRQFVVGNIPKDYIIEKGSTLSDSNKNPGESVQTQFEPIQNFDYAKNPISISQTYEDSNKVTSKPDDGYEEIEITPTAVAVEHGPRAIKMKRSIGNGWIFARNRRDSVIQVIPSKTEIEKKEEEEDLSNEILDIIDAALPENMQQHGKTKNEKKEHELIMNKSQKKRQEDQKHINTTKYLELESQLDKEMTTKMIVVSSENTTGLTKTSDTSITESSVSTGSVQSSETTTEPAVRDLEETTLDWFHDIDTTTQKPIVEHSQEGFNIFNFMRKIAEVKFRLGLTLLKHASEGFARYLGHVQKRINGEE